MRLLLPAVIVALVALAGCAQNEGASDLHEAHPKNDGESPPSSPSGPTRPVESGLGLPAEATWPVACAPDKFPVVGNLTTAQYRCQATDNFTIDGALLGFGDEYAVGDVRPGVNLGPCTASYLLVDETGQFYLTFSAHCVFEDPATAKEFCESRMLPIGTPIEIEGYGEKGTLAWTSGHHMQDHAGNDVECAAWDAAFVAIDASLNARIHPSIRHIGGPTGLADILDMAAGDAVVGYGNSDDRGFVVERVGGEDHGNQDHWPAVNVFYGEYHGDRRSHNLECTIPVPFGPQCPQQGDLGIDVAIQYTPSKITGDSGSPDLTGDGEAFCITSQLGAAQVHCTPLYDTLLRIYADTGKWYRLVTWDEFSPDTLETEQLIS